MEKEKINKTENKQEKMEEKTKIICKDVKCPFHGTLSVRGRTFRGAVIKKFPKRIAIEFERTVYVRKYERYGKSKTKLHARLPDCLADSIHIGDYVQIDECRPLSKIITFVVTKKIRSASEEAKK
ncbi:MAG: 30S ribosomal protein S17 [archaeon]|nr:30S ribosomal protein S17 [archaeon]